MRKKIIAILLLSTLFICSIGNVFGYNVELGHGNVESEVKTEEKLEGEIDNLNNNEKANIPEDSTYEKQGLEEYFDVTFIHGKTTIKKVKKGEKVSPPNVKLSPNTRAEWYDELGKKFDFSTPITSNMTLTLEVVKIHVHPWVVHIQFHSNGGTKVKDMEVAEPGNIHHLPTPTKKGHKFLGWFDKSGKKWKEGMTTKHPLDLYAKWKKNEDSSRQAGQSKTGDSSNPMPWIVAIVVAGLGIGIAIRQIRKK